MIRPLRALHRGAFVLLAVALPTLIVAAVRGRHAVAAQELPDELLPVPASRNDASEDWLAYWVDAPAPSDGALPEEAELVGSGRTGAFALPPPPGKAVIAYSLLERRVRPAPTDREARE